MSQSMICIHIELDSPYKALCEQYWTFTKDNKFKYKTKDLCQQYQVKYQHLTKIIQKNCYITFERLYCPICYKPKHIQTRKQYYNLSYLSHYKIEDACEACKLHNSNDYFEYLNNIPKQININTDNLPYEAAIKIYAGLQYVQKTIKYYRNPQDKSPVLNQISEITAVHNEILFTLLRLDLIYPRTPLDLLKLKYCSPSSLDYKTIRWRIVPDKKHYYIFMETLKNKFILRSRTKYKFIHESLCYELLRDECLNYLQQQFFTLKIRARFSIAMELTLQKYLAFFSAKKIYTLLYISVQPFKIRHLNQQHIANIIVHKLESQVDFYIQNPQYLTEYKRFPNKQSHINNILFDQVFKKHHCGFNKPLQQLFK